MLPINVSLCTDPISLTQNRDVCIEGTGFLSILPILLPMCESGIRRCVQFAILKMVKIRVLLRHFVASVL